MYKPSQKATSVQPGEERLQGDLAYTSREGTKKVGNRLPSVVPKGWEAMDTK